MQTPSRRKFFKYAFISVACALSAPLFSQQPSVSVSNGPKLYAYRLTWKGTANAFQLSVDDSPAFRKPIFSKEVNGNSYDGNGYAEGLAPGVQYYVRINPGNLRGTFRLLSPQWKDPDSQYSMLRRAWETHGRTWVHNYSGLIYDDTSHRWKIDPAWKKNEEIGQDIYYVEEPVTGALQMGYSCHDLPLLDELAQFYVAFLPRFSTLGTMRAHSGDKGLLKGQGPDSARTLPWIQKASGKEHVRECALCNAQFFQPAARLIRIITALPKAEQTENTRQFVKLYSPLIIREHLFRFLFEAEWNHWDAPLPKHEVDIWRALQSPSQPPKKHYQYAMEDTDLWLIGAAAEMLGAHANDPTAVPMSAAEESQLTEAVRAGVALFESKRTTYAQTKNLRGLVMGSASYFNGDYDDHPDDAYAGDTGENFPSRPSPRPGVSWDISHFQRVPIFLRSLYDNHKATGVGFPTYRDLQLVADQLMYVVFNRNYSQPLFTNYFDGSDGWYRVNYSGRNGFGYPPSKYCDAHSSLRPCLISGLVQGWGLIAFSNPDLVELEHSWLKLATDTSESAHQFKDRYYWYDNQPFEPTGTGDKAQYPDLLYFALSSIPDRLQGCPVAASGGK